MKKLFLVAGILLLLTGCGETPEKKAASVSRIGESCGGALGNTCGEGEECIFDFSKPDARGRCEKILVLDGFKCPKTQSPVCGKKGHQKNGYLNDCEMERHGATFVSKGFCEPDPSVIGNCRAEAVGIGTCFEVRRGYEYKNGHCTEVNVGGCDAEIPFASREQCIETCE